MSSAPIMVGRDRELAILTAALSSAKAGRGAAVLLSGEPGIGKTSLARSLVATATEAGVEAVWGRTWEVGGAPPYWIWIEVVRALVDRIGPHLVDRTRASWIAELVPELAERVRDDATTDPAIQRFRIGEAIVDVLRRAAHDKPVALVLDDLHAADRLSLEVLRFVVERSPDLPLVVLGTFREAEARQSADVASLLARVGRDAQHLALAPLDRDAVALLAKDSGLDALATQRLHQRTEGNPLFVVETLRLWRARGSASQVVPDSIREVVGQRLALLPRETRALLELGAAMGREVDLPWLCLAAGAPEAAVRATLRPALEVDVIAEGDPEHVTFTHVLLRDGLYRELDPERRVALHLALAEALDHRHAMDPRARAVGLAHHHLEAAPLIGLDRALPHVHAAAERAVELNAHEDAMALLTRALSAVDLAPVAAPQSDSWRADVLLALGLACMRAHEPARGKAACLEAAALARRLGDPTRLARAALAFGAHLTFGFIDQDLTRLLEEALHALPATETALRARLLARLAAALQPHANPLHPIALAREAIAIAQREDPSTRLEVLTAAGSALSYFAEPSERIACAQEMLAIATAQGDEVRRARALIRLAFDHLEAGDVAAADDALRLHEDVASRLRMPAFTWVVPLTRAARAIGDGRFDDARAALAEAESTPGRPTGIGARLNLAALRVGLGRAAREVDLEAERELSAVCTEIADPWYPLALRASSLAWQGDLTALSRTLAEIAPRLDAWRHRLSLGWLAEAAIAAQDITLARRIYPLLEPLSHRCHLWGTATMVCDGPLAEPLGRLALLLGERDLAVTHLEAALAMATRMGARPARARIEALLVGARAAPVDPRGPDPVPVDHLAPTRPCASSSAPPPVATPAASTVVLEREGDIWSIRYGGQQTRLKDSRGLQILAQLVAAPDQELHVIELLGGHDGGDAGEALDAQAIRAYRERATSLREELEVAESHRDLGRSERLREELDALARQLSGGVGLGGRARREASDAERARVNVRRRLVLAIERIAQDLPALGRHLTRAVKTGTVCVYRPDA